MQLWRTVCSTDWKGRPHHFLKLIAESDDRSWLIEQQNKDVAEWQAAEVADWNSSLEEGEPPLTEWAQSGERWEMQPQAGENAGLRAFVEGQEGEWTTTVYHILLANARPAD